MNKIDEFKLYIARAVILLNELKSDEENEAFSVGMVSEWMWVSLCPFTSY